MRKPLVAGNWKMNGSLKDVGALAESLKKGLAHQSQVEVAVFPSFIHIPQVEQILTGSPIVWGAQDLYIGQSGAFTGEVSGSMLADLGCTYVLVGHSERRQVFHEDLGLISAKFKAAQNANIRPILCVGETLEERENGKTEEIIKEQLNSVIEASGIEAFKSAVVAYEPVWAIGTGKTASPEQAQEVHAFIRWLFAKQSVDVGNSLRILYGGSVKADNAQGLFAKPDIDGGLVGGASLDAAGFLAIVKAALQKTE